MIICWIILDNVWVRWGGDYRSKLRSVNYCAMSPFQLWCGLPAAAGAFCFEQENASIPFLWSSLAMDYWKSCVLCRDWLLKIMSFVCSLASDS